MSATAQPPLDLDWPRKANLSRADFIEGHCNCDALEMIEGWRDWPGGRLLLLGPEASGKTHLAAIWARESRARFIDPLVLTEENARDIAAEAPAIVLDDLDRALQAAPDRRAAEVAVLHLFNTMTERGGALMMTARAASAEWGVGLPDLASRLRLPGLARIDAPDEIFLSSLYLKLFDDRSVDLEPAVANFLSRRSPRSFAEAQAVVDLLDQRSIGAKQPISIQFAKRVLGW